MDDFGKEISAAAKLGREMRRRLWVRGAAAAAVSLVLAASALVAVLTLLGLLPFAWMAGSPGGGGIVRGPRNLVVLLGDGFGPAAETMVRDARGPMRAMPLDKMVRGTIRTSSASSLVTDSAAGATAYSCGLKTANDYVATRSDGRACGTIFEAARLGGRRVGAVAKSSVTNATPASFTAHAVYRWMEQFIAAQQAANPPHVLFGGGGRFFTPKNAPRPGARIDGRDLLAEMAERGIHVVRDSLDGFRALERGPAVALFGDLHMDYVIDSNAQQPSLAEMTLKALDLLTLTDGSGDGENGFVLLVEGSRIDMAAHANDAAAQLREIDDYEAAVRAVVDWAERNGDTEVLSVADHETGGLSLGVAPADGSYPIYNWWPERLDRVNASAEAMAARILQDDADPAELLATHAGVHPTAAELAEITSAAARGWPLAPAIGRVVSRAAGVGFSTPGHTACDVLFHAYGFDVALFNDQYNMENADIGQYLIQRYGFDVQAVTAALASFNTTSPYPGDNRESKTIHV